MAAPGLNPRYERERRRKRVFVSLAFFALLGAALAIPPLLRGRRPVMAPAAAPGSRDLSRPPAEVRVKRADGFAASSVPHPGAEETKASAGDLPPAVPRGWAADDFAALKEQALALYRQNDLEAAQRQAQEALALHRDNELSELLEKLEREIRVHRDYDRARTANFIVLFDGYEHDEVKRTVLDILKGAYAEIGKELNYFPEQPITVILYTAKDFSDVTLAPQWAGGMFGQLDGKIRVPVQGASGQEQALRRVLSHEYTHALLFAMAPECPLWLHEGLAQYYSGEQAVKAGQLLPLGILADSFPGDARLAAAAYMESLQAVTDLVNEHGMPPLRRLLAGLAAGKGLEAAFAAAYGEPFSRWSAEWRRVERGEENGG